VVEADEAVAAVGAAAVVGEAADEVEDASAQPALELSLLQRLFGYKPRAWRSFSTVITAFNSRVNCSIRFF
jgi:hypothetical protein